VNVVRLFALGNLPRRFRFLQTLEEKAGGMDVRLYEARASEIARGQLGGLFQTAFTLYMFVGNQLALFNMIFLFTFGLNPINNLLATSKSECSEPEPDLLGAMAAA
jgi:Protein of unknown function (DUF1077)